MSSAIPNTLGMSLKVSSILHGGTCHPPALLQKVDAYICTCQMGRQNVVKYDNWLSNLILWYPELALMMDIYCTLLSLGNILLSVGPLCIGLISAWLSCTGSKHSHTLPFCFGYHHKAVALFCHLIYS